MEEDIAKDHEYSATLEEQDIANDHEYSTTVEEHVKPKTGGKRKRQEEVGIQKTLKFIPQPSIEIEESVQLSSAEAGNNCYNCGSKSPTGIFGEYVTAKLRGYTDFTRSYVQHRINDIFYEADIGLYNSLESIKSEPAPGHTD